MSHASRREFLSTVGKGMLVAGVGYGTALEMGFTTALGAEPTARLDFGKWQPLVDLLAETPAEQIQATVVAKLQQGVTAEELIGATALCNARAFGGDDYIGFHTLMALSPALQMSRSLTGSDRALPILKVLYRNAHRLEEVGGGESLRPIEAVSPQSESAANAIQQATHRQDLAAAESALAYSAASSADAAFNDLLETVEDATEVHRVVLAHRAWDMLDLVGHEHALTMLRQSVHYCVRNEEHSVKHFSEPRTLLPKLMDQYRLPRQTADSRSVDDNWLAEMSETLFTSTPAQAAEAAAAALAEGVSAHAIGQAVSIAANQLVLRDAGRPATQTQPNKPTGSIHGDSIGVHACDSAHAWRGIAAASNPRNQAAATILSAYQVARDRISRGGDFAHWQPRPLADELGRITETDAPALLQRLDRAIRENDQTVACAAAQKYGDEGHNPQAIFGVCLKYAISEDGALHAEKYFRTTSDEFATLSPRFRWNQVVALARVSASSFGFPAPGRDEAKRLLGVS